MDGAHCHGRNWQNSEHHPFRPYVWRLQSKNLAILIRYFLKPCPDFNWAYPFFILYEGCGLFQAYFMLPCLAVRALVYCFKARYNILDFLPSLLNAFFLFNLIENLLGFFDFVLRN